MNEREMQVLGVWYEAPAWASYRAEDLNGEVWFFEERPKIDVDDGYWYADDGLEMRSKQALCIFTFWTESLLSR